MWGRLFWAENTDCQVSSSLGGKPGQCAGEFTSWKGGEGGTRNNGIILYRRLLCDKIGAE